jgi:DNA repair protein RadD
MSLEFRTELSRAFGLDEVLARVGSETVELMGALDQKLVVKAKLVQIWIEKDGHEGILNKKEIRNRIFGSISEDSAHQLKDALGIPRTSKLETLNFSKTSSSLETLLRFFGFKGTLKFEAGLNIRPMTQLKVEYPLFAHQRIAVQETIDLLSVKESPRAFLHMPTGSGKTRVAMNVICHILRKSRDENGTVVWLAHNEELCEQAASEFERAWKVLGDRELPVVRLFSGHARKIPDFGEAFVVGGLQKMHSIKLGNQNEFFPLARKTILVVMDEAHQAIAPSYQGILSMLSQKTSTALLGISATPGRTLLDPGEDVQLADFFHRKKVTLRVKGYSNPVEYLQDEGYLAKAKFEQLYNSGGNFILSENEAKGIAARFELPESALERLGKDYQRNLAILQKIMEEADKGGRIIVFGCSVEHSDLLAGILHMKGYKCGSVTGRTNQSKRMDLIEKFKSGDTQILTTYDVLTTGFDAPKTNVAVITRPTNSVVLYSQMMGRAARGQRQGGNATCKIITVKDNIPGFRSVAEPFGIWEDVWQ